MTLKTKSLQKIESKMQVLEEGSLRYCVLDHCRRFKTSWIEFGQALLTVHKDQKFKAWGFLTFEGYCAQELGIRKTTAIKLLKSYHFLETEEPSFVGRMQERNNPKAVYPDVESVNLLRLVKSNKKISDGDYAKIRHQVLDDGKEPQEVRREIRCLVRESDAASPQGTRGERRTSYLKRLLKTLENAKLEAISSHFLPSKILDQMDALCARVEKELDE